MILLLFTSLSSIFWPRPSGTIVRIAGPSASIEAVGPTGTIART